jgi:serine protease Do
MNKKNAVLILLLYIILCGFSSIAMAESNNISVVINGAAQEYDQPPVIKNGTTLVPLRGIFETLGASVTWNSQTKSIKGVKGDTTINLILGSDIAVINNETVQLSLEAQVIGGRTFVPLRFVSESLGADVRWEGLTKTIYIVSTQPVIATPDSTRKVYEPQVISALVSPSILYIELYDRDGRILGSGSGFIIDSSGKVVTNFHVIDGAHSGKVRLIDASEYQIEYVLGYNKSRDIAILKIDVSGLPTVKLGDSVNIANGEKILAIGSPFGLDNTISDGLISNKNRIVNDHSFIQISAPISSGSSGGALLNYYGEVIGVTTASYIDGQNINLAVPINDLSKIPTNAKLSLADIYEIEHMIYYNDATYEGEIVDGEPHGFGILTFNNGDKYTGDFENNWFHGVGLFEWSNGDVYIGDFDEGLRTGFGIYTWASGDQYEGGWLNGERHGYGIYTYPDGTTDKGMWKNNQFQG